MIAVRVLEVVAYFLLSVVASVVRVDPVQRDVLRGTGSRTPVVDKRLEHGLEACTSNDDPA